MAACAARRSSRMACSSQARLAACTLGSCLYDLAESDSDSRGAGNLFNKGKALGMLGRSADAEATFLQAIEAARGASLATYAKSFASLRNFTAAQMREMQQAAWAFHSAAGA